MRRRAPGKVPSSIRLDHGDILVMDGLAQSEYAHWRQGPRVDLTYRWVTQHAASCPPAGVVGCVLPTCAQGLVEPSSRWLGEGENKRSSFWGIGPPFVNPGVCLPGQHLDLHQEGASSQWSASIPLGVPPLSGSCPLGWETAFTFFIFSGEQTLCFKGFLNCWIC